MNNEQNTHGRALTCVRRDNDGLQSLLGLDAAVRLGNAFESALATSVT